MNTWKNVTSEEDPRSCGRQSKGCRETEGSQIHKQSRLTTSRLECRNKFNKQYTPATERCSKKAHRTTLRKLKRCAQGSIGITAKEIELILKGPRPSKALGPDKLSPIINKKLGSTAHQYIAGIFSLR